jgi:CRISPR-associated helicase Cas3
MEVEPVFRVAPYWLPRVAHATAKSPLYPHQATIWDRWDIDATTVLAAKTGTGKTRAVMLPLLARKESGVAVYPTNELLRDQVRAVEKFAAQEDIRAVRWLPGTNNQKYADADTILVPIDRRLLDEWQRVTHCKYRGETLRKILDPDKPKIVFVNPDILFGILALRYHADALGPLQRYQTLVFDEFHLYQGVELAHALTMVGMARSLGFFKRVMLLSATPHPDVKSMLDRLYAPYFVETATSSGTGESRRAVHAVEVTPVQLSTNDPVDTLFARLAALRPELERLRAENSEAEYIPAVVIVNSVVNAIRLEDKLVESGFARDSLAIIRGLSNRDIRSTQGKLLALGTSAIEVGVDFHCDYLLFEATEAASFMQRFGRVGRHRPGKAIALVPPNVYAGMNDLPAEIDRPSFEERINAWYPSSDAKPWFVTTEYGMITSRALAETFIGVAKESGVTQQIEIVLRERLEKMLSDHADRLGCQKQNLQARLAFERSSKGNPLTKWLKVYCALNQFRTSLPSVLVHDFTEEQRRQDWELGEYEADLRTLLKRAVGITWNAKLGKLTIKGIGKLRKVHASEMFSNNDCGVILETKDYDYHARVLRVYQDNESTPISDLMARKNHIFALVRKTSLGSDLDWRLPVFEAGEYFLAFDGAALLLLEMARNRSL